MIWILLLVWLIIQSTPTTKLNCSVPYFLISCLILSYCFPLIDILFAFLVCSSFSMFWHIFNFRHVVFFLHLLPLVLDVCFYFLSLGRKDSWPPQHCTTHNCFFLCFSFSFFAFSCVFSLFALHILLLSWLCLQNSIVIFLFLGLRCSAAVFSLVLGLFLLDVVVGVADDNVVVVVVVANVCVFLRFLFLLLLNFFLCSFYLWWLLYLLLYLLLWFLFWLLLLSCFLLFLVSCFWFDVVVWSWLLLLLQSLVSISPGFCSLSLSWSSSFLRCFFSGPLLSFGCLASILVCVFLLVAQWELGAFHAKPAMNWSVKKGVGQRNAHGKLKRIATWAPRIVPSRRTKYSSKSDSKIRKTL